MIKAVICALGMTPVVAHAETSSDYIKKNAIEINSLTINQDLLVQLGKYKVLIVGVLHGSTETPAFVFNLAKKFSQAGKKVSVGIEIPISQQVFINDTFEQRDPFTLQQSPVFQWDYQDGKESMAMAILVAELGGLDGIDVFGFDRLDASTNLDRNLGMARPMERIYI